MFRDCSSLVYVDVGFMRKYITFDAGIAYRVTGKLLFVVFTQQSKLRYNALGVLRPNYLFRRVTIALLSVFLMPGNTIVFCMSVLLVQ